MRLPDGWDLIKDQLQQYKQQMDEAVNAPHDGKRRNETLWPIHLINHQRTRYIYDLYKNNMISDDLLQHVFQYHAIDKSLFKQWDISGYTNLCCLQCIQQSDFETVCVCRVPYTTCHACVTCGCHGCASNKS